MKKICVIGCGPAGAVVAALLKRIGYDVLVIAKTRRQPVWEGMSMRAVDGLGSAGFQHAVEATSTLARRFSAWHGHVELANGEYLIEKQALERALQSDLSRLDIALIQGTARHCERNATQWCITVAGEAGTQQIVHADYLITACGRTGGENIGALSGPVSVMLSQSFSAQLGSEPFTFIEPFEDGWAWATWNGINHASLHVMVASTLVSTGDCTQVFTSSCKKLGEIQKMIGARSCAVSPVSARGCRPFLKGAIADAFHLKVGDAAYTVDPLSGHGMYEAISGAYAAVPVIHTLLERPQHAELALRFYRDRAQSLFAQRMRSSLEIYRGEIRWAGHPFWAERSRDRSGYMDVQPEFSGKSHFVKKPVVENGWIVEREILLSKGYPQGTRFIDGVDLAQLHRRISTTPNAGLLQLSEALMASPGQISSAMQSLVREGMVERV
jgi:flavin-dependent dehydrogenase